MIAEKRTNHEHLRKTGASEAKFMVKLFNPLILRCKSKSFASNADEMLAFSVKCGFRNRACATCVEVAV